MIPTSLVALLSHPQRRILYLCGSVPNAMDDLSSMKVKGKLLKKLADDLLGAVTMSYLRVLPIDTSTANIFTGKVFDVCIDPVTAPMSKGMTFRVTRLSDTMRYVIEVAFTAGSEIWTTTVSVDNASSSLVYLCGIATGIATKTPEGQWFTAGGPATVALVTALGKRFLYSAPAPVTRITVTKDMWVPGYPDDLDRPRTFVLRRGSGLHALMFFETHA